MSTAFKLNFILFFLLVPLVLNAQNYRLNGKVMGTDGSPIIGATIATEEYFGTFTDNEGKFVLLLPTSKKNYTLTIRSIGYESLDTSIQLNQLAYFLQLTLKEKTYIQDEVEIIAKKISAFDRTNWKILDFIIEKDKLLVLYTKGKKQKLGLYNLEGFKLNELDLFNNYQKIEKSCTGTILLLGRQEFIEFYLASDKINRFDTHAIEVYEKLLQPCVAKIEDELIFKRLAFHNKRALFLKYPKPNKPSLIYEVIDEEAAMVSQSYYCQILGTYHQTTSFDIIDAGLWDGDLKDLMISWDLFRFVTNYINLETKEVHVDEFIWNNSLFLVDYVNKKILEISSKQSSIKEWSVNDFSWLYKKSNFLRDSYSDDIYWIDKKKELFQCTFNNDKCKFNYINKIWLEGQFQEGLNIYNKELYYITYDYRNQTKLVKQKIN